MSSHTLLNMPLTCSKSWSREKGGNRKASDSTMRKQLERARDRRIRDAADENNVTKIQMIFQDPVSSLAPRMTVREIIAEGLRIQGVRDEKQIDDKVYEVLEKVGLLIWIAEAGNFYGLQYLGYSILRIFSLRKERFEGRKNYYEYCLEKIAKQKENGKSPMRKILLIVGGVCLVLPLIFAELFYKLQ